VESHTLLEKFDRLPGVPVPPRVTQARRLDYGSEVHLGRTTTLSPVPGEYYPALVSQLDDDCNEVAGIRLPDLQVPVATYTGWNLRHPDIGNPDLFIGISGGLAGWTLPFPATRAQREASGDPRLSLEERYATREEYLDRVQAVAQDLVQEGYLLAEDLDGVIDRAARKYDYYMQDKSSDSG
jgi:hypothetical protein